MSLINDVTSYLNHKDSPLFVYSLDAEGAYNDNPIILLKKLLMQYLITAGNFYTTGSIKLLLR